MVPFASYVILGQSKPRLIFSPINGPIVTGQRNKITDAALPLAGYQRLFMRSFRFWLSLYSDRRFGLWPKTYRLNHPTTREEKPRSSREAWPMPAGLSEILCNL